MLLSYYCTALDRILSWPCQGGGWSHVGRGGRKFSLCMATGSFLKIAFSYETSHFWLNLLWSCERGEGGREDLWDQIGYIFSRSTLSLGHHIRDKSPSPRLKGSFIKPICILRQKNLDVVSAVLCIFSLCSPLVKRPVWSSSLCQHPAVVLFSY